MQFDLDSILIETLVKTNLRTINFTSVGFVIV